MRTMSFLRTGRLDEKVAIITGATSGIGRAIALAFAGAGVRVIIGDIRERPVGNRASTAEDIRQAGGRALFVLADVSQKSQVEELAQRALQEYGRIDILVNNAGLAHVSAIEHTSDEVLRRLVEVNLYGVVYGVQAVLPVMRAQGSGHIINIASGSAMLGLPYAGIYGATKAAIARFSESLRYELEETNIRVSVIFPDLTATDLALEVTPDRNAATRTVRPFNQEGARQYGAPRRALQSPDKVARAVLNCALRPQSEVHLSLRIRLHALFRCFLPAAMSWEARKERAAIRRFLEKVAKSEEEAEKMAAAEKGGIHRSA